MTSPVQDVGVDHGSRDILVAQEFLDGSDIVASFEQMRSKGMAKRVASCTLDDSSLSHGFLDDSLEYGFVDVVAAFWDMVCRKGSSGASRAG
jgi:hypothetical protein